ncbi:MAG: TonB family protein [Pyrinomonadaceae bacterium]
MQLKSDFMHSCRLLTAILFALFLSLTNVKAQTNDAECSQPAPLSQSKKADIIKNVRQIIGGYNPKEKKFYDARDSWYDYFKCVEAPALRVAHNTELNVLYAKIGQSGLSSTIQSLDLNAENAEAKSVTAEIMMLNGQPASELVQQAIAIDPEYFEAHFLLGILNSNLASIERSIALNPSFASAYNLKAELLLSQASKLEGKVQRAKYQTALETIKTMLALPSPPEAEFWREQQNSLIAMLKPDSPSKPQATTQTSQTQPVLPATTPTSTPIVSPNPASITVERSDGVGTGRGQGSGTGIGQGSGSETAGNRGIEQNSSVDVTDPNRRLNLLSKPRANYTELARMTQTTGTVRVRVTFSSNGQIENVLVISFLPFGLTQQAVKAAKQIKFVPETRNNTPISVSKMIEYNFMLY